MGNSSIGTHTGPPSHGLKVAKISGQYKSSPSPDTADKISSCGLVQYTACCTYALFIPCTQMG